MVVQSPSGGHQGEHHRLAGMDMIPKSPRPRPNAVALSPAPPLIIPINQSLSSLLVLANSRRLTLMQSRLDYHEVELHNLHARIDMQRALIERLMQTVLHLRGRTMVAERTAARIEAMLRTVTFHLGIVRARLAASAVWREGSWRVRMSELCKHRRWITKMLLSLAACHAALHLTHIYSLASGILDIMAMWVPERARQRLKTLGNLSLLFLSFFIWQEFVGELASVFPFNLML